LSGSGNISSKNIFIETAAASLQLRTHTTADNSSPLPIPSSNVDSIPAGTFGMNGVAGTTNILNVGAEDEFIELQKARNRSNSNISTRVPVPVASSSSSVSPGIAAISASQSTAVRPANIGGVQGDIMTSFSDKYVGATSINISGSGASGSGTMASSSAKV
jgi:hypothetical protein